MQEEEKTPMIASKNYFLAVPLYIYNQQGPKI